MWAIGNFRHHANYTEDPNDRAHNRGSPTGRKASCLRSSLKCNTKDNVDTWANGKLFTGRQAVQKKLIDQIGSKSDAVKKVKELGIIDGKIEWVKPEQRGGLFNMLFGSSQAGAPVSGLLNTLFDRFGLLC